MSGHLAVGVDVGATNVRVVLGDDSGKILVKTVEKTVKNKGPEGISNQIIRMIQSIQKENSKAKKAVGIGIGSAGPLDLKKGGLMKPTNLPFDFVPLVDPLREAFKIPTYLLNDCASAVLGEKKFGLGKDYENLVYITISTGIGGGVVVDNHLLTGKDGNAHEIGHFTIDSAGRLQCGCGKRGHWEAYCSGTGIPNYVKLLLKEENPKEVANSLLLKSINGDPSLLTTKALFDAAKAGDRLSIELVEQIGILNAVGFACVIDAYDPSVITVGGAIALNNADLVIAPIKNHVGEHARNRLPEIFLTNLGEYIVAHGALSMVFENNKL
ncbi:MAG: ROK family protein [Candidatus Bathyarchaeia archaeon]